MISSNMKFSNSGFEIGQNFDQLIMVLNQPLTFQPKSPAIYLNFLHVKQGICWVELIDFGIENLILWDLVRFINQISILIICR